MFCSFCVILFCLYVSRVYSCIYTSFSFHHFHLFLCNLVLSIIMCLVLFLYIYTSFSLIHLICFMLLYNYFIVRTIYEHFQIIKIFACDFHFLQQMTFNFFADDFHCLQMIYIFLQMTSIFFSNTFHFLQIFVDD